MTLDVDVSKRVGEPIGIEVHSALFDEVRTCDNHCEFCFIYQLPPNLRKSLYLKDDDYRLSFLYGNYTTLTRFTEADLERVITERLSPLNVSIHATDPAVRQEMLRNRRGASSLRWLSHSSMPTSKCTVRSSSVLGSTMGTSSTKRFADVADRYRKLATVCVVPLGVSKYSTEERMRPHTPDEAAAVVDLVEAWQEVLLGLTGRRLIHASDEFYLAADRPFPPYEHYGDIPMHEDGVGMARAFESEFTGTSESGVGTHSGFFAWVDAAPAEGYRAPRTCGDDGSSVQLRPSANAQIGILTGEMGAKLLQPLIDDLDRADVRIIPVDNQFFGGNVGVAGLMVGEDLQRVLADQPHGHRYFLPDVCLNRGMFLDGLTPADLPRPVEVIETDGVALRKALLPS